MRVGITGHQERPGIDWKWSAEALHNVLISLLGPLEGYCSLAIGADQLFAQIVLDLGGALVAVIPSPNYERFFHGQGLQRYQTLRRAAKVIELPGKSCSSQAFFAAGKFVVDRTELLLALWDGQEAHGLGGTGDIVEYARCLKRRILHFNPITLKVIELD
jgi:hypothetical protein